MINNDVTGRNEKQKRDCPHLNKQGKDLKFG